MDESKELQIKSKKQVKRKRIANSIVMICGLLFVISFVNVMQNRYSEQKSNKTAYATLDAVIASMDENTKMVDELVSRYHQDNQIIVDDFYSLFHTGRYSNFHLESITKRCEAMRILSESVDDDGYLFVVSKEGKIELSPFEDYLGVDLISNRAMSKEDFDLLFNQDNRDRQVSYINGRSLDGRQEFYLYGRSLSDQYCLIYGVPKDGLKQQYEVLSQLGPILSSVSVGKTGFLFAVDKQTGKFKYYDDGNNLTGLYSLEYGIERQALNDGYEGTMKINGEDYRCVSRDYSSKLYGNSIIISSVCASEEIYQSNTTVVFVTAMVFIISAILCLFYAFNLQTDLNNLVFNDDNIQPLSEVLKDNASVDGTKKTVHNIFLFNHRDQPVYFKIGLSRQLLPVILLSLLTIFAVSYNCQTLIELSKGQVESESALVQLDNLFSSTKSNSEVLRECYQNQYLSKVKLLSYMLEEDPTLVFKDTNTLYPDGYTIHQYKDQDYHYILNEDEKKIYSLGNSQHLDKLAKQNGFDSLFIFDDQGRTIATNTDHWYFILSQDETEQSHEFTHILKGEVNDVIQEPQYDQLGDYHQYIATAFYYYTLKGEGKDDGKYISESAYQIYLDQGTYDLDGVNYEVISHKGILEGSINDDTISSITQSITPEYLLHHVRVDSNGSVVLFDNSEDHVCMWTESEGYIGKTASQIGILPQAFDGNFKGFVKINGSEYFQNYILKNDYWIATYIPTSDLFMGRMPIALITLGISACFFAFLYFSTAFTFAGEEFDLMQIAEKRINEKKDNGIIKIVMKDGKEKYARTATSRFTSHAVRYSEMIPTQRLGFVFRIILGILILVLAYCVYNTNKVFGETSIITYIISGRWQHSVNYFAILTFIGTVLLVFAATSVLGWMIRYIISNMGTRTETIGRLFLSVLKYGSVLFSIFYGLSLLGVSTTSLVTSASIMSIVIGLGSQSLISDILAGIFIVFEGSFRVGDIVNVDNFAGSVVDIGLRTTKVEDNFGNIKIYNNSSIKTIVNMTKKASVFTINLNISYKEDLEKAEKLIKETCLTLESKYPKLLRAPKYMGVSELTNTYMTLTISAMCSEPDRIQLSRDLQRKFYLVLRDNDIICPYQKL